MAEGIVRMSTRPARSRIIGVTGVDGSGKTTLTTWLREELRARGHAPGFVWSRFNNYLSLPFLALTRATGHNVYRDCGGVRMGFHEFERLPTPLRHLFVALQMIDVNIATLFKINLPSRRLPVTICERGPWDTLVDVTADTAFEWMASGYALDLFGGQVAGRADIVLIDRSADLIEAARPELVFDVKLRQRQELYRRLAEVGGWTVLDNNDDLDETKYRFSAWLTEKAY